MYPYITIFSCKIPSYGLCMLIGISLVISLGVNYAKKKNISFENVFIISAFVIGAFLLGAWLLYVFVSFSFSEIIKNIQNKDFSFLKNTGLVYYGGLAGGLVGGVLGCRVSKTCIKDAEDIFIPLLPLGHSLGRIGCFLAGCCNGIEYHGIFSVRYMNSQFGLSSQTRYLPTQIFEALINIIIAVFLLLLRRKENKKYELTFSYLFLYGISRFFLEFLRGDIIRGIYRNLSVGQWISIFIVVLSMIYFVVRIIKCKKRMG